MHDLMTFLDFAMDIVCMMPPLNEIEAITLTRDQAVLVSLGAIGFLALAFTISALKEAFPENTGVAVIAAICVVGIGFIGLKSKTDMLKGIFLASYPPMVMAFRLAEGAIVGSRMSRHLRWWHLMLLVIFIAGLYYLLKPLPINNLVFVKGGWALFGAGLAALLWTRMMANSPVFLTPLILIGFFMVFASTLVYVSVSYLERAIYQWALPIGLIVGIVSGRVSRHSAVPPSERESAAGSNLE